MEAVALPLFVFSQGLQNFSRGYGQLGGQPEVVQQILESIETGLRKSRSPLRQMRGDDHADTDRFTMGQAGAFLDRMAKSVSEIEFAALTGFFLVAIDHL